MINLITTLVMESKSKVERKQNCKKKKKYAFYLSNSKGVRFNRYSTS